jgi:hypothetical protein
MAKALRTGAMVVGAVALVATGVGALAGAGVALGLSAGTLGTIATIATVAQVASAGLAMAASIATPPRGSVGGNPTKFKIDKEAGLPYAIGRTLVGGNVLHRQYYGAKNAMESWVTALSLGPVKSLGPLLLDKQAVAFSGGAATGSYAGHMWLDEQLGACPETTALTGPNGPFPGWAADSKLSGLAADLWTMKFDTKGKVFPNGVPGRARVLEGVFVYDPRQDSTYPGGDGPCRVGLEETYVWSENPALHALTWAYGRVQNGVLVAGGGLKVTGVDVAPFVEWANVCHVNAWKVGGLVYTNSDDSWDVLKMIAQAGGGEVMPVGAVLSCTFSAPRVSIGTIRSADLCGDVDVPATASRRLRRNTVIAQVRLESHGWEMVPLEAASVPEYVEIDGGKRPREIAYPLVQQVDQGVQLGLYNMLNARELDGITLPCKIYAIGLRPGDCVTLDIPEASMVGRDVIVRNRELDARTMGVTLSCRSETPGKHAFALGQTGTPPPTPDLTVPPNYPGEDAAQAMAAMLIANSSTAPTQVLTAAEELGGGTAKVTVIDHVRLYPDGRSAAVTGATFTGLLTDTPYFLYYDDIGREGGVVDISITTDAAATVGDAGRHRLGRIRTPVAGSGVTYEGGGAYQPGGTIGRELPTIPYEAAP